VIVYCAHGWAWDREASDLQRSLVIRTERLLSHVTDSIVCISEHDNRTAQALGINKRKLVTISNGIAPSVDAGTHQPGLAPPYRDFLFVGRFDRQKGVDIFLKTMHRMAGKATGYAIGDSVLGVARMGDWPDNVLATGWLARSEVSTYMQHVGALVMPSRWEGFGLVALEAMRAGRPVIAARVGGLQDLIVDGVTGFLFEPNSPQALEAAMERALASDLNAMGKAARERFLELYTSDRMNRTVLSLYDSLTAVQQIRAT
jgi:glycosyltransferase involved in cell wall biosynthesis